MSKTITFKPEFEEKLKELRIKTRYIRNLRRARGFAQLLFKNFTDRINSVNKRDNWRSFISSMAVWSTTLEGYEYWSDISNIE